jgi:CheY-like chemotaxis protein
MGGIALLQSLRCWGEESPFILLTRNPEPQGVLDAFNHGVAAVIDTGAPGRLLPGCLSRLVLQAVQKYRSSLATREERERFRGILDAQETGLALINPGDEVIIPDPFFVMYEYQVLLMGGVPVFVDTYPDFRLREEEFIKKLSKKTNLS